MAILNMQDAEVSYDGLTELRKKVKEYYPNFTDEINPHRNAFLTRIRNIAFKMLTDTYNTNHQSLQKTFEQLLMLDTVTLISRKKKGEIYKVEQWNLDIDFTKQLEIYKKGISTIGLRIGKHALTIRFKFESSPATSIKLATSFELFEKDATANFVSLERFESYLNNHQKVATKNKSNAIGKCNEAMVYYRLLKNDTSIDQVNEETYIYFLEQYSPIITNKDLLSLREASIITAEKIYEYLNLKHGTYQIQSIELVPESYIKDHLDTTDLKLVLIVNGRYKEEDLSLKALARKGQKIAVKNPGAGTILGDLYFNVGDLTPKVNELKDKYLKHEITRRQCLEQLSVAFSDAIIGVPTENIQRGIASLIGKITKVITLYKDNECVIVEPVAIAPSIQVLPQKPTPIQTTFQDTKSEFMLTVRAKFSSGEEKGWSSLKFVGEMGV